MLKKGFKIANNDIYGSIVNYMNKGALKGEYLGFPNFHKYYTMSLPGVTDWTGFPQSGKTQVLMEFLINTSLWYGWKHFVYFPDVGDEKEIIADIIQKLTGKSFDLNALNRITEQEVAREISWVLEHFKILVKDDLKASLSPIEFWDYGVELSKEVEGGIQTMSIDSWKDLTHNKRDYGGRDDLYLEYVLSYRNAIAEKYKMHLHTIIHPTRTDKDKNGNRKAPGPYDLKGGTEWFNNGKCMITIHRPSGTYNDVEVHINKIKPRSVGSRGIYRMKFDVGLTRYYWLDENNIKRFAEKLTKEQINNLEVENNKVVKKVSESMETKQNNLNNVADLKNDDEIPF